MGEVLNVAKALASPTEKLIDMVGRAIGTAYEPKHRRKMAEATAYEIKVIGDAIQNSNLPVSYVMNGITINSEEFNELVRCAGNRLILQEITKQQNIENVVDDAYEILATEEKCSTEPIEQGRLNRFFDSVADISDEDLQKLWGKVLAGEVKNPNTYSLRTLETLKNLSKYEAELFQKIAPYIIVVRNRLILTSNIKILEKYDITYDEIIHLDECGLINSSSLIALKTLVSNTNELGLHNSSQLMLIHGIDDEEKNISIGEFSLTVAGRELFSLLHRNPNNNYFYDFAEDIEKNNKGKISIALYKIKSINDEKEIQYTDSVLFEFPQKKDIGNQYDQL